MQASPTAIKPERLHTFLIADWRAQPRCHVCCGGAAYYQCRCCDKGVHPECLDKSHTTHTATHDTGCVIAGCDGRTRMITILPNEMSLRHCGGHWLEFLARVCPPRDRARP